MWRLGFEDGDEGPTSQMHDHLGYPTLVPYISFGPYLCMLCGAILFLQVTFAGGSRAYFWPFAFAWIRLHCQGSFLAWASLCMRDFKRASPFALRPSINPVPVPCTRDDYSGDRRYPLHLAVSVICELAPALPAWLCLPGVISTLGFATDAAPYVLSLP
ncbi:hypothetical protein VNO77_20177 [Canavalia gladiata]|uniref:Uncharacterized protein n=1 Tax=Canavalia gladiata TaxID=3824 RepID=A0AAN9LPN9_CANGL